MTVRQTAISVVLGAILTAVVSACGSDQGVPFSTTLLSQSGDLPLPVTLRDQTGLVTAIGTAQVDQVAFRDAGVLADPADPKAFILTWLGGMCDSDAELAFRSTAAGYDLHMALHEKLGGGCPAAGVPRGLRIESSSPVGVASITISGSKTTQLILDEDCGPLTLAATSDAKFACLALITATIGDQTDAFESLTVSPDDGACPETECSTAAGIEGQLWRVDATDRQGVHHAWRCAYHRETASCTVIAG